MTIDRSRRITFDEVADLYDEVRPSYPDELIQDVLALSGIPADGRILEIGCGPGNATVSFARRGYRILGIELGERLAALAARNCSAYPGVEIINSSFEGWKLCEAAFDLAIAADSFHWIRPEVGYPKAARALKETGSAAFFWNMPVDPATEWSREIEAVYQSTAPGLENPDKPLMTAEELKRIIIANYENSGCFGPVIVRQYFWHATFTSDQFIKLLRTFSGHHGLDEETRKSLYAGIRNVLEKSGGQVIKPLSAMLFQAKVG